MMPEGSGGCRGMDVATIAYLPTSLPVLDVVLRGAGSGPLVGSLVLCRARQRRMRVEAWAVTATWSSLGASVALAYLLVRTLM